MYEEGKVGGRVEFRVEIFSFLYWFCFVILFGKNIIVKKMMFWYIFKKMGEFVLKIWLNKKREVNRYNIIIKKGIRYGRDINRKISNKFFVRTLESLDDIGDFLGNINDENWFESKKK